MLQELHRQAVSETTRHHVGHQEGAAARVIDSLQLLVELRAHGRLVKGSRKLLPERARARIGELEDFATGNSLRDEGELLPGGEDRRILTLHEAGKRLLHETDRR